MTAAWVIGGNGLLGSALRRKLAGRQRLFLLPDRFRWLEREVLHAQFAAAVQDFAASLAAGEDWSIYWAAGVGTMNSKPDSLVNETGALAFLLQLLGAQPRLRESHGLLAFASSAGAIYAGCSDEHISEQSQLAPTTAYAAAKLAQEALLGAFAQANEHVFLMLARISTIYGSGQSSGKGQGLLTHIARCVLKQKAIQIYVPFDTVRDYITADDAAAAIVNVVLAAGQGHGALTKIVASERPTTIAEIIATFKRISRHAPRIVTCASQNAAVYTRRIQYRSTVLRELAVPCTSLAVGIAQLLNSERDALARGR